MGWRAIAPSAAALFMRADSADTQESLFNGQRPCQQAMLEARSKN